MANSQRRIILVTQNVRFAIDIKRALEETGDFSVSSAANARNAIDFLREHGADLLLLDTDALPIAPEIMIDLARARAQDIVIVLAPDKPETRRLAEASGAAGVVDMPVMARALLPVLHAALAIRPDSLPPMREGVRAPSQDTAAIESLVDGLVTDDAALSYTRRRLQASYELLHPPDESQSSAEQSLLELHIEPADETDTVRFHTVRMPDNMDETALAPSDDDTVRDLAERLALGQDGEIVQPTASAADADPADQAAFQDMLNQLLDESTALDDLRLESLFDTTQQLPGALGIGAAPRWLRESDRFIQEPTFLEELLPRLGEEAVDTTAPAQTETVVSAPESSQPLPDDETAPSQPSPADAAPADDQSWLPLSSQDRDPLVAQLALTMTQTMTDLTADATLLSRNGRIHAYSGELPLDRFHQLRRAVADDWSAPGEHSRLRFIRLPDASADYMLYSRGTIAGYSLTLIFAGGRGLREIRRQGDSLLEALSTAPAPPTQPPAEEPVADSPELQPFAFVWLLADPAMPLRKPVAEQLLFWLEVQLNSLGWHIRRLDVHGDFIYLYANVPGDAAPESLIRQVMERSRQIACAEDAALPGNLWADAYLVLQPGRPISERELGQFLQFARA